VKVELLDEVNRQTDDWKRNGCKRGCDGDECHLSNAENESCQSFSAWIHDTSVFNGIYSLAKVFRAVMGNSISISIRSWLKRLRVTPVSVVEKKDIGDLFRSVFLHHPGKYSNTQEDLPQYRL
jgi:hypothetical protein